MMDVQATKLLYLWPIMWRGTGDLPHHTLSYSIVLVFSSSQVFMGLCPSVPWLDWGKIVPGVRGGSSSR